MKKWIAMLLALVMLSCGFQTLAFAEGGPQGLPNLKKWKDLVQIEVSEGCVLGLRRDGSVLRWGGDDYGLKQVERWKGIQQILFCSGFEHDPYVFGLKKDGTVVSTSEADVSGWRNIKKLVSCKGYWVAGLRQDGTVVVTGKGELCSGDNGWSSGWLNVSGWRNIVDLVPLDGWTAQNGLAGICADGTVRVTATDDYSYTAGWTNITALCSVLDGVFGLKSDGTLAYPPFARELDEDTVTTYPLLHWAKAASLTAGHQDDLFAVNWDGTVETESSIMEYFFADSACYWEDIQALYPAYNILIGLRTDGTLVCASDADTSKLESWKNIQDLRIDMYYDSLWVVGLKKDGTAVFAEIQDLY